MESLSTPGYVDVEWLTNAVHFRGRTRPMTLGDDAAE